MSNTFFQEGKKIAGGFAPYASLVTSLA